MKLPYRLFVFNGPLSRLCHRSYYRFNFDSAGVQLNRTSEYSTYTFAHNLVSRGLVSSQRTVPDEIVKPNYVSGNRLSRAVRERVLTKRRKPNIEIKSNLQIQGMRDACRLAREILNTVGEKVSAGITTDELDALAHNECIARGAYPSPLLYRGFPKSICTSVNNVACHGIPDDRPLLDGDIINIDVTVYYKGFHGDVSETYPVGNVDSIGLHVVGVAKNCRDKGIGVCGPGQPFNLIGQTVRLTADEGNCYVIPVFCGHGIGSFFHGPPDIIHIDNDFDQVMKEGMTFTIEPVITEGEPDIVILDDGWTAVTTDGSRSAQFEHTILITKNGVEILTL